MENTPHKCENYVIDTQRIMQFKGVMGVKRLAIGICKECGKKELFEHTTSKEAQFVQDENDPTTLIEVKANGRTTF